MALDLENTRTVLDTLYKGVDSHGIWDRNRWFHKEHIDSLGYGEVGAEGFLDAMARTAPRPGEVFYDLGSGTGKAVFLAAMLFDFKRVVGIELMDSLGGVARRLLSKYDEHHRPQMPEVQQHQELAFIDGSFIDVDFSSADVIFTHSTVFSDPLWAQLVARMEGLKPGTRIVCASKEISSPEFELKEEFRVVMPWGRPQMRFYARR